MKNKIKYLLLMPCLLCSACGEEQEHIYVSSIITQKWDRQWNQIISNGKVTMIIPHHDYFFTFNEWKPYTKPVSANDYATYEIGDIYTFVIDEKEQEYFFEKSMVIVKEED